MDGSAVAHFVYTFVQLFREAMRNSYDAQSERMRLSLGKLE